MDTLLYHEVSALIEDCERLQPADAGIDAMAEARESIAATLEGLDGMFDRMAA